LTGADAEHGNRSVAREVTPHVVVIAPPATYVQQWREYFGSVGWRVTWISYAFEDEGAVAHIPEIGGGRLWTQLLRLQRERRRLASILRDLEPDLVHAHWLTGPGWLMSVVRGRPFIVTVWGSDVLRFAATTRFRRLMARRVGRTASAITYDADLLADALVRLGLPRERMRRIVFGADGGLFRPRPPDRAFPRHLGVTNDAPVVLFLRGLDPVYEPETVIRGFAHARRQRACNLLIRIDHPHSAGPFAVASAAGNWSRLHPIVRSLGIDGDVFPYTSVAREELPTLLTSSSVFLSVSNSDGTSVALLEALFSEVPVVVSDLPANREWILDETYGSIVPVGDAEALGDAIVRILDDPGSAAEKARRAGEHARREGDAATEFERTRQLSLETVTGQDGRRG
jgi:glycosyltransferase involved in cell wall biosynthesis